MELQYNTISTIVFIVLLIFPGLIFKRFYFQGQFTKQFQAGTFADRIITNVFWGVIVQIVSFITYCWIFSFKYESVRSIIDKAYEKVSHNQIPSIDPTYILYILGYLVYLIIIAAGLGYSFFSIIRFCKFDIYWPALRFSNKWNYMIKGEILSTKEFKMLKKGKVSSTEIDIIIEDSKESVKMISGVLIDYTISEKSGELETLHIMAAQKYIKNESGGGAFKEILGDYMVIPCHRMVDMNIRYLVENKTDKPKANSKARLGVAYVVGQIAILVLPAYLSLPAINRILFVLFGSGAFLFLLATFSAFFPQNGVKEIKTGPALIILFIAVVCLIMTLNALRVINM